jgi:para-aminobenzoate synthetase/4-amino-4-deoxychorismate lyase
MVKPKKNDALLKDGDQWLHFRDPHKVIIAETPDQVIPALHQIEGLVEERNWHAAGFLSYEAASAFDSALITKRIGDFPYLWFGLYPQPQTVELPHPKGVLTFLDWHPTVGPDTYNAAIERIKENIADGRTYQVNYTMRLETDFNIDAWEFFLHLTRSQNNHAAYIDTDRYQICSASPELFFELDGDTITCRPMKGTIQRGRTTLEDQWQSEWLKNSEKNRAENVMIVDMIRNDLGRIARIGSVRVPELFCTERYPTLWQMTSTIKAETNTSIAGIFRALFPCASITGAPKTSTMRIINSLETRPRSIYTGAIGSISPSRKARFSVAIRTVLIDRKLQKAEYGVGGGIVWDSTSADEYAEALLKAGILSRSQPEFSVFETMLWTPEEGFFLKEKHLDRLLDSANYFDFAARPDDIENHLEGISVAFESPQRVRLLLDRTGQISSESTPFQRTEKEVSARLALRPVNSADVFLFHKTTHRNTYENAGRDFPDSDDVLLFNQNHELTEFTIGNLVVEIDGKLITPPIECGLLPGTFRAYLVETGQVVERIVPVERLEDCTKIFRVNSVRQWERVSLTL